MSMLKGMSKEELINEIYVRSYTKNYLFKVSFDDGLDYIACKIKKELGNFTTIQTRKWDEQCSSTKSFIRKLNERHLYSYFKDYVNRLDIDIQSGSFLSDILDKDEPNLNREYLKKDRYESQVKWFVRIINDKNMIYAMCDYDDLDFHFYGDMYRECEKVSDENIKQQEMLIKEILDKSLSEVDLAFDDKQMTKFINTRIAWLFGNKRRELPGWKEHTREESKKSYGSTYITSRRMHVLQYWFGLNGMFDTEIQELKFLTKSQKEFIINCLKVSNELSFKRNKRGHIDLSKKELSDRLGLSLYAIDKKMVRIREKVKNNGVEVTQYYNKYKDREESKSFGKFRPKEKDDMIDGMYISEEERMMYLEAQREENEQKDEIDMYFESRGLSHLNYNYW